MSSTSADLDRLGRLAGARAGPAGGSRPAPPCAAAAPAALAAALPAARLDDPGQTVKTTLPKTSPSTIRANPSRACASGISQSTTGLMPRWATNLASRSSSARVPMVEPTTAQLPEEDLGQLGLGRGVARRGAGDDDGATGSKRVHRVRPGRGADGLHHRVDPFGQPLAGAERAVRADLHRPRSTGLVPRGHPDAVAGRRAELDDRRGDAAAGTLDQDRRAGRQPGVGEQHPVGREPGGRQARGVGPGQLRRLGHEVLRGHPRRTRRGCRRAARTAGSGAGPASRRRSTPATAPRRGR